MIIKLNLHLFPPKKHRTCYKNELEAGDKFGLMFAESGNQISEQRVGSARDIWQAAGVEIGFEHYAYWEQAKAFDATERLIIANPDIKAIYAGNSSMAMGVDVRSKTAKSTLPSAE